MAEKGPRKGLDSVPGIINTTLIGIYHVLPFTRKEHTLRQGKMVKPKPPPKTKAQLAALRKKFLQVRGGVGSVCANPAAACPPPHECTHLVMRAEGLAGRGEVFNVLTWTP